MPTTDRPASARASPKPNFQNLRKRAKHLLRAYKAGDAQACSRIQRTYPKQIDAAEGETAQTGFSLQDAQLVIAREHGFASWTRMKHNLQKGKGPMRCKNPMVIHYVHDMDRATKFYTQSFQVEPITELDGWATLDFGSIVLGLHTLPAGSDTVMPNAGLNLEVENIEEIQADIEELGGHLVELREAHGHVPRVACFKDPEGNGFELRQQVNKN